MKYLFFSRGSQNSSKGAGRAVQVVLADVGRGLPGGGPEGAVPGSRHTTDAADSEHCHYDVNVRDYGPCSYQMGPVYSQHFLHTNYRS